MVASVSDANFADHPLFGDKASVQSEIWYYLLYIANSQTNPTDTIKPVGKSPLKSKQSDCAKVLASSDSVQRSHCIQFDITCYQQA